MQPLLNQLRIIRGRWSSSHWCPERLSVRLSHICSPSFSLSRSAEHTAVTEPSWFTRSINSCACGTSYQPLLPRSACHHPLRHCHSLSCLCIHCFLIFLVERSCVILYGFYKRLCPTQLILTEADESLIAYTEGQQSLAVLVMRSWAEWCFWMGELQLEEDIFINCSSLSSGHTL